ncbi:MAG TPA: NAD(P)-dependent oxidoreductase [Gemmatimonadaceae bacterium]|nr:NAD(P)-dependent oxidoreductase [Thermoanaerobaculia bacterium]HXQ77551.1 NAD(P)-dependent oxidoreductase [Gemmatimonadaceae bacterium]
MKLPFDDLNEVAARVDTGGLRGKTIVITGGTGFIGRWMAETFAFLNEVHGLNAQMFVVSRSPKLPLIGWDELPDRFDLAIHGATPPSEELAKGGDSLVRETVDLTHRMLNAAERAGAQRFLYLSSGAVYGKPTPYGETKQESEHLCAESPLITIIARAFAFIGPHIPLTGKFAAGNFLKNALAREPIDVRGDGTPLRSYMYMSDLAIWLWTLLLRGNGVYDVGSEEAVSIAELACEAGKLANVPVTIHGVPESGKAPERYVPETTRARTELGLRETVGWRTALRKTYDWYRESA